MLTKREHRMLELISYTASVTYTLPLTWNDEYRFRKFSSHHTKWRRATDSFSLGLTIVKLAFLIIRLVPGLGYAQTDFNMIHWYFVIHVLTIIPTALVLGVHIGTIAHSPELARLANQLFHFNRSTGELYYTQF